MPDPIQHSQNLIDYNGVAAIRQTQYMNAISAEQEIDGSIK